MNTFQILTSKFRFDLMHWNVSIGPEKWPIFGLFLTLFPLKIPPTWRRPSVTSWMTSRKSPLYNRFCSLGLVTTPINRKQMVDPQFNNLDAFL
jgi:hypothetical protein